MALKPGHDLNYIAVSGILTKINRSPEKIQFPMNLLADFISASLGITGTLAALKERTTTNQGR
jgi:alpha-methylacyl-CoA racemase